MTSTCDSSIDYAPKRKDSCDSHVSVYYEQNQPLEEGPIERSSVCSCSSEEKILENPPVEIHEENTTSIDLPPLTWHGYDNCPKVLTVTNTGRTILINGHWANSRPYIEGGPLNGTYLFSQIHFHCPSEHEIDGRRYPLEMHIVHYKTSYLTQERAMNEKDGTVVLVYLFQVGVKPLSLMDASETIVSQITRLAPQLREVNSRTESSEIPLDKLIKPFISNYYVYRGSVATKKSCYLLQWIISCSLLGVTQQEVDELSNIITCALGANIRQTPRVQPENDAIYHVGEEDYSLPPLKTLSANDICNVCKCHEVPYVNGTCRWKRIDPSECDDGTSGLLLVCDCKSRTHVCTSNCKMHKGRRLCSKCKSYQVTCRNCGTVREGEHTEKHFRSRQSRGRRISKLFCELDTEGSDGALVLNCECANESSASSFFEEVKCKKKKRQKEKKTSKRKSKKSPDGESEKSTSKSSMSDDKSKVKFDKVQSCESAQTSDAEPQRGSRVKERRRKPVDRKELPTGSDQESEKGSSRSVERKPDRNRKKKKNEVQVIESVYSLKGNPSKQTLKASTEFCYPNPNSSGLLLLNPKSPAQDDETKEETKKDPQTSESKTQTNPEAADQCSNASSSDREKKKAKPSKDDALKSPVASRSLKSRSKSRTKLKDRESSEGKTVLDSAARSSKSKSPVFDVLAQKKVSMRKESEGNENTNSKSKVSESESNKSKVGKSKKVAECNLSQSVQEMKCLVTKSTAGMENLKCDSKSPRDIKIRSNKLRGKESSKLINSKSKEERKGKNEADSNGQNSKLDYNITTLFEKKPDGRNVQSLAGDCNDVKINFLLTPNTNAISIPSCVLTSDSDFTEEKKALQDVQENRTHFVQDFTVNTATIPEVGFPSNKLREMSQACLLMEHVFRTEHERNVCKCTSQEYHVAVMCDQLVVQEYRGKFHPQELQLGNYEVLQLIPKYPDPGNSNFQLQDCSVKKESLDEICIRVKFLLKELNVRSIFADAENGFNEPSEKKEKLLLHQETQCDRFEYNLAKSRKKIEKDKIFECWTSEISVSESKSKDEEKQKEQLKHEEKQKGQSKNDEKQKEQLKHEEKQKEQSKNDEKQKEQSKNEEKQNQQSKNNSLNWEWGVAEPQKYAAKLRSDSDVCSHEASQSSVTEGFSTDSNFKENKMQTIHSGMSDKKLKPLFVKRRKTVYFVYDKVEKDESTGKKVFVGSFKTKEEVDNLKKQKELFQENEAEKSEVTSDTKYLLAFENKEADLEFAKPAKPPALKSSDQNSPSTSQDASLDQKKDLVTLHKYQPKHFETNRPKKECKNVLFGKALDNLEINSISSKNLGKIVNVDKEKTLKTSTYELQQASESESQKENPDADSGKSEKKSKAKNAALTKGRDDHSQSEVIVPEKSNKAEEDSARDNSQKSLDKKESQAALILMPVEVESLSKYEVILIEHLGNLKKDQKEDECSPYSSFNK